MNPEKTLQLYNTDTVFDTFLHNMSEKSKNDQKLLHIFHILYTFFTAKYFHGKPLIGTFSTV